MKKIDIHFALIRIMDTQTVLIQARDGVEIDAGKSQKVLELIAKEMPADYGIIVDRKADYSIVPLEVYRALNETDNLKAIAIALNGKRSVLPENTEKNLFRGELAIFQTIAEAHEWISRTMIEYKYYQSSS